MRIAYLGWLLLGACTSSESFLSAPPESPLALGASTAGYVRSSTCKQFDKHSECESNAVTATYKVEPAGVVSLTDTGSRYSLRALAEGEATITIDADDGSEEKTFVHGVTVLAIDTVTVKTVDTGGQPCVSPFSYEAGMVPELSYELRNADKPLLGAIFPFTATGVTIASSAEYDRVIDVTMPTMSGTGTITSSADSTLSLALRSFTPEEAVGILISDARAPVLVRTSEWVGIHLDLGGGHPSCQDTQPRTVTTMTPEICKVSTDYTPRDTAMGPGLGLFRLHGVAEGSCTVVVALDGTAISAMRTFEIGAAPTN